MDAGLHDAEWRITLVQALIVTFLGVLFFTSPSPVAPVSDLRPVPYALAAMCLALAIRVAALAILPRISRIWAYLSVVMDVSVIIALIWSFHLQYGESLALFLKAPTQLYLFVVIAWHGLTLDPLRVAFAGIMAAAGWLLLMLASIYQGGEEIITRDFMTYMMSSRVLIGAEIDRIIAILLFRGSSHPTPNALPRLGPTKGCRCRPTTARSGFPQVAAESGRSECRRRNW